jgi:hypothetical protein
LEKSARELPPRWISHFGGGGGGCWAAEKSFAPMLCETCYGIETARAEHTARGASARAYKLRGYDGLVKRCAALLINSAVHIYTIQSGKTKIRCMYSCGCAQIKLFDLARDPLLLRNF